MSKRYVSIDEEGPEEDGDGNGNDRGSSTLQANPPSAPKAKSSNIALILTSAVLLVLVISEFIYFQTQLKVSKTQNSVLETQINSLVSDFSNFKSSSLSNYDRLSKSYDKLQANDQEFQTKSASLFQKLSQNISDLTVLQDGTKSQVHTITKEVNDHEDLLTKLTNHTSNAEVLDEMKATKQAIYSALTDTESSIGRSMDLTSRNVTNQLAESQRQVNSALGTMKSVVESATSQIYSVQRNVTNQLSQMTSSINQTKAELNIVVLNAQTTIHSEVAGVKDDIEQYVAATNKQFAAENDFVKYQLAGTFTLLGCLISLWHMTSHLRHYEKPDVQRRVMAVLWMVPIYGITSWLSLVLPQAEAFLSAVRDCYEAYVVYTFIALLVAILEDGKGLPELLRRLTKHVIEERQAVAAYAVSSTTSDSGNSNSNNNSSSKSGPLMPKPKEHMKPPFPCCYVPHKASTVAAAWLYQCRLMAMQFVIMKPLLTLIPFILRWSGYNYDGMPLYFHEQNNINWKAARFYIILLQNISVAIAFYGLLSFYHGTEEDLAWCDPWPKFLCIKGVVFMTFWQGVTLQAMGSFGMVDEKAAMQIQNLLICVEMLLASLAHIYIFPYHEWQEGYKEEKEREQKKVQLKDTLALRDFVKDMRLMVTRWEPSMPDNESQHGIANSSAIIDSNLSSHDIENGNTRPSTYQNDHIDYAGIQLLDSSNNGNDDDNGSNQSKGSDDSIDDETESYRSLLSKSNHGKRESNDNSRQRKKSWTERARQYIYPSSDTTNYTSLNDNGSHHGHDKGITMTQSPGNPLLDAANNSQDYQSINKQSRFSDNESDNDSGVWKDHQDDDDSNVNSPSHNNGIDHHVVIETAQV